MDYELLNEINDNDAKEMEEYRIEEPERDNPVIEEGCIFDGARGIYIFYLAVRYAIENGFNPSDEWKEQVKRAQEKGEDEEDYLTHNYEWIFDEMENAEDWLNAEIADDEHYFGTVLDGTDWGYWEVEEDWLSI
jgi:hypothetical protein